MIYENSMNNSHILDIYKDGYIDGINTIASLIEEGYNFVAIVIYFNT
jgi:hypothetical protein